MKLLEALKPIFEDIYSQYRYKSEVQKKVREEAFLEEMERVGASSFLSLNLD